MLPPTSSSNNKAPRQGLAVTSVPVSKRFFFSRSADGVELQHQRLRSIPGGERAGARRPDVRGASIVVLRCSNVVSAKSKFFGRRYAMSYTFGFASLVGGCGGGSSRNQRIFLKAEEVLQILPKFPCYTSMLRAAVAQLDRVLGYEPRGRGFESCQPHQNV